MRKLCIVLVVIAAMLLSACAQTPAAQSETASPEVSAAEQSTEPEAPAVSEQPAEEIPAAEASAADAPDVETEAPSGSSDLIVYFSWSGNTRQVADAIQQQTGADVFEIVPVNAYPEDYDETVDVGQQEKRDGARPEFQGEVPDLSGYDRIFIGFPNWWGDMPMILYTFLEGTDLSGKTIAPFVTSSSSGFSGTRSTMESLEPDAQFTDGLDLKERELDTTDQAVSDWLAQIQQ
ncbi:MAG: flavodoxin [Clostridia bacterium]|nr:flavodoxin [Clostridia bacterium]